MKTSTVKTLIYALIFGASFGIVVTVAMSVFIPKFFPEWAGSLVCSGRVEFMTLKQAYYCYVSPTVYFDLSDAMFWAVFKRFLFPDIVVCSFLVAGVIKAGEFLWERREAAGF